MIIEVGLFHSDFEHASHMHSPQQSNENYGSMEFLPTPTFSLTPRNSPATYSLNEKAIVGASSIETQVHKQWTPHQGNKKISNKSALKLSLIQNHILFLFQLYPIR